MNPALDEYIQTGSADAFRRIVDLQIDSVYSHCLRRLHNIAQAQDVTQIVFATLAQKAAKLPNNVVLEGWLFTTTRFCCSNALRAAARRTAAEQKAATMNNEAVASSASEMAALSETEELLDDAIDHLGERNRNALLLRYFGGRSLRDVGEILGVSEDAARQRIFRAVEKFRDFFKSKGITADSAAITASLGMAVKPAGTQLAQAAVRFASAKTTAATISKAGMFSRPAHPIWTLPKVAAAITAVVGVTVAVVVASRGGTPQPATPRTTSAQFPAAPLLADVPPPDATEPSDQSTPVNTLKKLSAAVQADNRPAISECLCDDGLDPDSAAMGRRSSSSRPASTGLKRPGRPNSAHP